MNSTILAYFDPGSGSMLVQMLIGGVAGFLVFARYAWDHLPMWLGWRHSGDKKPVEQS